MTRSEVHIVLRSWRRSDLWLQPEFLSFRQVCCSHRPGLWCTLSSAWLSERKGHRIYFLSFYCVGLNDFHMSGAHTASADSLIKLSSDEGRGGKKRKEAVVVLMFNSINRTKRSRQKGRCAAVGPQLFIWTVNPGERNKCSIHHWCSRIQTHEADALYQHKETVYIRLLTQHVIILSHLKSTFLYF